MGSCQACFHLFRSPDSASIVLAPFCFENEIMRDQIDQALKLEANREMNEPSSLNHHLAENHYTKILTIKGNLWDQAKRFFDEAERELDKLNRERHKFEFESDSKCVQETVGTDDEFRQCPQHYLDVMTLRDRAIQANHEGQKDTMISLLSEAIVLLRLAFDTMSMQYARTQSKLADLYRRMGAFDRAGPLFNKAAKIIPSRFHRHDEYVSIQDSAAWMFYSEGDYAKAKEVCNRILDFRAVKFGEESTEYLKSAALNCLSQTRLMENEKDLDSLCSFLYENYDKRKRVLGSCMETFWSLGALCRGRLKKSRTMKPSDHPDFFDELMELCKDQVREYVGFVGPEHIYVALSKYTQAELHLDMGMYEEAQSLLDEAERIHRAHANHEKHPDYADCLQAQQHLHVKVAAGARPSEQKTHFERAWEKGLRAFEVYTRHLATMLSYASERRRVTMLQKHNESLDKLLNLAWKMLPLRCHDSNATLVTVVRRKSILFQTEAAQGTSPELAKLRKKWLRLSSLGSVSDRGKMATLETRIDEEEEDLLRKSPVLRKHLQFCDMQLSDITEALQPNQAILEFKKFIANDSTSGRHERYLMFMLLGGNTQGARMSDIGPATTIDDSVNSFRKAATASLGLTASSSQKHLQHFLSEGCRLRKQLLDPLLDMAAGNLEHVFLALDGNLQRLPFSALPRGDELQAGYVIDFEELTFSLIETARDVIAFGSTNAPLTESLDVVLANPKFDILPADTDGDAERMRMHDFLPLPGSLKEAQAVKSALGHGKVLMLTEANATWVELQKIQDPRILHLATHIFFVEQDTTAIGAPGEQRLSRLQNPMGRSGIALVGARVWQEDLSRPVQAENGILTALEVLNMQLEKTKLVVLSGCDSGLGSTHLPGLDGYGVAGLSRAFRLAGAEAVVTSLWHVLDDSMVGIMTDFYGCLMQGQTKTSALRIAQRRAREKYPKKPFLWAGLEVQGDPRPITSA